MKKFLAIAVSSVIGLVGVSAHAAIVTNPNAPVVSLNEVLVKSFQPYAVTRSAFQEFRGVYALDNGAQLRLSRHGRTFYAEVSGQPRFEVRATSSTTFAALNGDAEINFEQAANGVVSRVVLKRSFVG